MVGEDGECSAFKVVIEMSDDQIDRLEFSVKSAVFSLWFST